MPQRIAVRPYALTDCHGLALLFTEMQEHYRVPCPAFEVVTDGLGRLPDGVEILVAAEDSIVGFVAFSAIYPGPHLRAGLFVKELFVSEKSRGRGIGKELMHAVARIALEREYNRVDWTADRRNSMLWAFYEGLGAMAQEEKVFFRLSGTALTSLAKQVPQES